jgi:hypothetical protein
MTRKSIEGDNVKYMLQVRFNGADAAIAALPAGERETVVAEFEAILETPGVLDGNQLQPAGTATTISIEDGRTTLTEGPAVAPGVTLDGYYLYDAADRAAAIALAERIPAARHGATIEVRPVVAR